MFFVLVKRFGELVCTVIKDILYGLFSPIRGLQGTPEVVLVGSVLALGPVSIHVLKMISSPIKFKPNYQLIFHLPANIMFRLKGQFPLAAHLKSQRGKRNIHHQCNKIKSTNTAITVWAYCNSFHFRLHGECHLIY